MIRNPLMSFLGEVDGSFHSFHKVRPLQIKNTPREPFPRKVSRGDFGSFVLSDSLQRSGSPFPQNFLSVSVRTAGSGSPELNSVKFVKWNWLCGSSEKSDYCVSLMWVSPWRTERMRIRGDGRECSSVVPEQLGTHVASTFSQRLLCLVQLSAWKTQRKKSESVLLFAKGISMNSTDSLTSRFNADLTDITFFLLTSATLTVSLVVKR